jgi:hypothetical protein
MTMLVEIDYTNWLGVRSKRKILPHRLIFDSNEWHPVEQWLLVATDYPSDTEKTFALSSIHSWSPSPSSEG